MYGGNFKFNGKYSDNMYGAIFCNDGNPEGRQVGLNYSTLKDKSTKNGYYNYYGDDRNNISFNPKISFQDIQGNPRKLNSKERKEIIEWLLPLDDSFKKLEVQDNTLVYYVKFSKLKWKEYMQGDILELEVETDSAYAFSPVVEYMLDTQTVIEKDIIIDNYSNVDNYYLPYIKIISYIPGDITISNVNLNESITIKDIVKNETILINCDREWVQSNVVNYKYDKVEGTYLKLKYGRNHIKVKGKGFVVAIKCEYPMLME